MLEDSGRGFRSSRPVCVCCRSGRCVWLLGWRHGLGSLSHWPGAGLRVPGHLLLLSADLGHLPHRAPLQHSRAAPLQGALGLGGVAAQRAPPPQRPQQRLWGVSQRARRPCTSCTHHRHQAEVFLCPGGGKLCDLQCKAAKQGGMNSTNWILRRPIKKTHYKNAIQRELKRNTLCVICFFSILWHH